MPNTKDGPVDFICYVNPDADNSMFLRSLTCRALSRTTDSTHVTERFTESCKYCRDSSMNQMGLNQIIRVVTNIDKNSLCHAHFFGVTLELDVVDGVMAARPWSLERPPWWISPKNIISPTQLKALFAETDEKF